MALIQLFIAILATYRLARLLPQDDGPLFIFTRIREYISTKAMNENDELGIWNNIDKWSECPYCQGLYAAIFVSLLVLWQNYYSRTGRLARDSNGNILLLIFAIAGGQSLLQEWSEKR